MRQLLPATVTTIEAVRGCVKYQYPILYVDMTLYRTHEEILLQILSDGGYRRADIPAQKGVFYVKGVDMSQYSLHDPWHLY